MRALSVEKAQLFMCSASESFFSLYTSCVEGLRKVMMLHNVCIP
jgi:hypothetical protein